MIIVAGKLYVLSDQRDAFVERSLSAVRAARQAKGCRDFAVSTDLLELNRVNIYELWDSEEDLQAFRQDGPDDDLSSLIVDAQVVQYRVHSDEE